MASNKRLKRDGELQLSESSSDSSDNEDSTKKVPTEAAGKKLNRNSKNDEHIFLMPSAPPSRAKRTVPLSPSPTSAAINPRPGPSSRLEPIPKPAGSTSSIHEVDTDSNSEGEEENIVPLPQQRSTSTPKFQMRSSNSTNKTISTSLNTSLNDSIGGDDIDEDEDEELALRRQYNDLTENCQDLEEREGFEEWHEKMMHENLKKGARLFKKIRGGPGDMHRAFLHTSSYSAMIRTKIDNIGITFRVDSYFKAINDLVVIEEKEQYNSKACAKVLSIEASFCFKSLPQFVAIIGSFDRNVIQVPKEKKPPKTRVKKQFDETNATQHEEINVTERTQDITTPEHLSQEILKIMQEHFGHKKRPINLFEFILDKKSFSRTIENLFYVSFLIRDGYVSVENDKKNENPPSNISEAEIIEWKSSNLTVKPDSPPKSNKNSEESSKSKRNQLILPFSPRMWRAMCAKSKGDDIIASYKNAQMSRMAAFAK